MLNLDGDQVLDFSFRYKEPLPDTLVFANFNDANNNPYAKLLLVKKANGNRSLRYEILNQNVAFETKDNLTQDLVQNVKLAFIREGILNRLLINDGTEVYQFDSTPALLNTTNVVLFNNPAFDGEIQLIKLQNNNDVSSFVLA